MAKKLGPVARYGARYGVRIRQRILEIEREASRDINCPRCGLPKVQRVSTGVYQCRHCNYKYAARAYASQYRKALGTSQEEGNVQVP
ncbi:MAG: 50S ribosomal protein L37ae [Methanomassiliicoccales archaeon]